MRFHLSGEQVAIQDAVRGTLADSWPMDRLHAFAEGPEAIDRPVWTGLMALGVGGLLVPEDQGGAGLGLLEAALVSEVLGEFAAPGPVATHMLAARLIAESDSTEAKAYLPGLISGETVATIVFGHGWTPDTWGASPQDGGEALAPGAAAADLLVVSTASGGLSLVPVADGVTVTPVSSTDRTRRLATVRLDGAHSIPLAAPVDAARAFDDALVLIAADALGGAQRCTTMSVDYAKSREQFGQPIGRFQAVKHQLAQMALEVEPARALVWYAAYAADAALPDASRAAAMAKAHLADLYVRVTRAAVAAHGGIGYTWEHGLHYWFRRSVYDRAYLGSPSVHRARAADMAGW